MKSPTFVRSLILLTALPMAACIIGSGDLSIEKGEEPIVIDSDGGTTSTPSDSGPTTTPPSTTDSGGTTTPPPSDPGCNTGELKCDDVCTAVTENDLNCGACGNECGGGQVCLQSACACEVGEFCDGACVDTTSSLQHCGACGNACTGGQACIASTCTNVTEVEGVVAATNAARAAGANCGVYGSFEPVPPLDGDPELHIAAQVHADDMATNDFFSHTGSDGSSFVTRIGRTNFSGQPIGENIAAGGNEAGGVVDRWVDSDGHCRNLMNPSATKIGVGYAPGGPYGTSWVQVFGR